MIVAVIQARMGSHRLPGKVLADIGGQTMLLHQLGRVAHAKRIDAIVVATSVLEEDDAVANVASQAGIQVYRGSINDVLGRVQGAGKMANAQHIVRLTADCPMSDPQIIDEVVALHMNHSNDLTANVVERTYPDGLDVEVCAMSALAHAAKHATSDADREHVTTYMYRARKNFQIGSVRYERDLSKLRWTVDFPEDLAFARDVFAEFPQREDRFSMHDVLELLERKPELSEKNAMHVS